MLIKRGINWPSISALIGLLHDVFLRESRRQARLILLNQRPWYPRPGHLILNLLAYRLLRWGHSLCHVIRVT